MEATPPGASPRLWMRIDQRLDDNAAAGTTQRWSDARR